MYIPDLCLCWYGRGPFDADSWNVPLRAVGWLEHPSPWASGASDPALAARLAQLVVQTRRTFFGFSTLGHQECSLCVNEGRAPPGPPWSQQTLFVPGNGEVFVAPGGIVHYVESHSYSPPGAFVEAVFGCPDCDSAGYLRALRKANAGLPAPCLEAFLENPRFIEVKGITTVVLEVSPMEWHSEKIEAIQATSLGGDHYRLKQTPLYAPGYSFLDVVHAQSNPTYGDPVVRTPIEKSGNRSYTLLVTEGPERIRNFWRYEGPLERIGCAVRFGGKGIDVAGINVPATTDAEESRRLLRAGADAAIWRVIELDDGPDR